ncbi:hypothetical protein [Oceanithermus sp.]|uniref:hypothetical protein n=1 Tax=Oceanithermus sp. TaxID=2268145 RepID=UPI00257D5FDB|nr:hypothetical protein [Oceanithermus sp.]
MDLIGNENGTFTDRVRALETTDPAHPDTWNPQFQDLITNDAILYRMVQELGGTGGLAPRVAALEALNIGARLDALEAVNADARLSALEAVDLDALNAAVGSLSDRMDTLESWAATADPAGDGIGWDDVQNKPTTFAPDAHTHPLAEISDWPAGVDATELGYLDGVTGPIQTQLDGKADQAALDAHVADADPHPQYLTQAEGDARYTLTDTATAPSALTVGASPFEYQNPGTNPVAVIVQGGDPSLLEFSRDGTTYYDLGVTAGMVYLAPGDRLRITYATTAPNTTVVPL